MIRRLFFLLPNKKQAAKFAVELEHDVAIKQKNIHAVALEKLQINGVADVQGINETDEDAVIEWWLWRINLVAFFVALLVFVTMLIWSPSWWLIVPVAIMVSTFAAGLIFALRIPMVHVGEFFSALRHGEILMMVDVKPSQVYTVNRYVHQYHPHALTGGVGWHMNFDQGAR